MQNSRITIRKAELTDLRLFWEWVNEAKVRAQSFSDRFVTLDEHKEWFEKKIVDPRTRMYVAVGMIGEPMGQVRFDVHENEATISISVDQKYRGRGVGSCLLETGIRRCLEETSVKTFRACVKEANVTSIHLFEKTGFRISGKEIIRGHTSLVMIRNVGTR
jgi:RimJ/RimL family protein N-acetyltransferase